MQCDITTCVLTIDPRIPPHCALGMTNLPLADFFTPGVLPAIVDALLALSRLFLAPGPAPTADELGRTQPDDAGGEPPFPAAAPGLALARPRNSRFWNFVHAPSLCPLSATVFRNPEYCEPRPSWGQLGRLGRFSAHIQALEATRNFGGVASCSYL